MKLYLHKKEELAAKHEEMTAERVAADPSRDAIVQGAKEDIRQLVTDYGADPDSGEVLVGIALAATTLDAVLNDLVSSGDLQGSTYLSVAIHTIMHSAGLLAASQMDAPTRTAFDKLVADQPDVPTDKPTGYL